MRLTAPRSRPSPVSPAGVLALFAPVLALAGLAAAAPATPPDDLRFYQEQVRPVLARRCLGCHASRDPKGGLALDTAAGWRRGGHSGPAITPGDPEKSLLVRAVRYATDSLKMPPGGKLPEAEIRLLEEWVRRGAPAPAEPRTAGGAPAPRKPAAPPPHWAWQPIRRVAPPTVRGAAWCRTPVDRFILQKLESKGLRPSPEADRRTLIRRVTFDLTGLPPTPEEVDAFLNDRGPTAWEKVVDRLLASPRYGERWGRHWLDVVHYGDTHGYDKDKRRDHAWPYRDYVIRALNEDRPYDRFLREQVAGDVLYPDSPDGVVGTGFIAAGPWDFVGHVELREGTVEKEKTRVLDRDDMVASAMSTFNSVTIHCARCHDHKFDPIPQRDYYRLQAVFAGVDRGDRSYLEPAAAARNADAERRKADAARRLEALRREAAAVSGPELARVDAEVRAARAALEAAPVPAGRPGSPANGWHSGIEPRPDVEKWVQVDLGRALPVDAVRLLPARPTDFPDTPGFGFPARFRVQAALREDFSDAVTVVDQTGADVPNPGDRPVTLPVGREARFLRVTATRLWKRTGDYLFALAELQAIAGGRNVAAGATVASLDSIEMGLWARRHLVDGHDSRSRLPEDSDPAVARYRELERRVAEAEAARRAAADRLLDPATRTGLREAERALALAERDLAALPPPAKVYAPLPIRPRPISILARGDVERPTESVGPGALSCLQGLEAEFRVPAEAPEGARRAALAEWLASPKNPLTWRSIVNRVWHYHFGRGLVDTPNDFGRNGSAPTHPELLDWLASVFAAPAATPGSSAGTKRPGHAGSPSPAVPGLGGSLKRLHRLLLLSAVYRQASTERPEAARVDADNRLLWRMNRQRLDAESLRDTVLAVSGKLDLAMGGPGFELFRFKDDHSPVYDYEAREKVDDPRTWRRTVYRFTVRSVQNPFLECMDAADPNLNTPVRSTTLTALQALALLNDPFMVRQSEFLAVRVRRAGPDPGRQVDAAYRLAYGRLPRPEERTALTAYASRHGMANACRLLLNANEFVFVD